ncbi:MAG: hypothetical protein H6807_17250 [Planctomycetes bacterium]|nr:hypothetical protein [Planctomycetota bacterium]
MKRRLTIHLLVALAALLATTGVAAQESIAALVAKLGGEDYTVRTPAYQELRTRLGPDLAAELRKRLPEFDPSAQSVGLYLAQSLQEPDRRKTMQAFLAGKPSLLRLGAAAYLLRMGEKGLAKHIVACLESPGPDPAFSLMLGRLLGIDDAEVIDVVRSKLGKDLNVGELSMALRILAQARHEPASAIVAKLLEGEGLDDDRRARCAAFLCVMGDERGKAALVAALPGTKTWSDLYFILDQAKLLDREILDRVLERAGSLEGYELRYAIQLLVKHDHRPAAARMRDWLEGDDSEAVKAALDGLISMGEDIPREKLVALLSSKQEEVSVTAADTLRRLDDHSGLERLIVVAEKGGSAAMSATMALGKFRDRRAVPPLIRLLSSANVSVRQQAFHGLRQLFQALFPYRSFDFDATGYLAAQNDEARRAAIALIEAWWQANAKTD